MSVRSQGYGLSGAKGDPGAASTVAGPKGDPGSKGDAGPSGTTLLGTVTLTQTATVAIALGIREVTVALTGAAKGGRYLPFCDSYKLNGGASIIGRPPGYALIDAACNTDGQITVALNAPLLAIGQSYALTVSIVRVNA